MRLWGLVALSLLLPPAGVRAEDIGPAQAQALQRQLKDWLAGLLGPSVKLPDMPWTVTGERDHYAFIWPIPGLTTPGGDAAVKANLRPLDGSRWSIDQLTLPSSGSFTMTLPDSGDTGVGGPLAGQFSIGRQDTSGVIDTKVATASTVHTELGDFDVKTEGAKQRQQQHFDRYLVDTTLAPTSDGRLDLTMEAAIGGWKSASQINGGTPIAIGIQTMRAVGRVKGVNRDRVSALLAATGALIGALPPDFATKDDKQDLPPKARAQFRLMVASLQDMLTAVTMEESIEGLQVEVPGMGGLTLKRFLLGFGGDSVDGRLHAWIDMGLDELASPSLPPKIAAYLPHHIRIKPSVGGVLMTDLHKLALNATEEGADADSLAPDIAAIFSHGGVDLGLEKLSFDLGPAQVDGTGSLKLLSPDTWHGEAHLVASGFDDLAAQARTNPELQQALPVLIMMRGLAKPDGKKLVWDIVSDGPSIKVNGLDLSQLGGNDQPKGKPPAKRPGQPQSR